MAGNYIDNDLRSLTSCPFCLINLYTLLENSTDGLLVISLLVLGLFGNQRQFEGMEGKGEKGRKKP